MENTVMIVTETTATETQITAKRGIELGEGRILPGGVWEINPFNEEGMHPDDRMHPISA